MSVAGVLNEPCTVWFAVVGVRVGLGFLCVLHSAGLVLLRFGDVSGCAEWAVPIVICCWWREFWRWREIRFFCVPAVMAWVLGRWSEIRPPPSSMNEPCITLHSSGLPWVYCGLWADLLSWAFPSVLAANDTKFEVAFTVIVIAAISLVFRLMSIVFHTLELPWACCIHSFMQL